MTAKGLPVNDSATNETTSGNPTDDRTTDDAAFAASTGQVGTNSTGRVASSATTLTTRPQHDPSAVGLVALDIDGTIVGYGNRTRHHDQPDPHPTTIPTRLVDEVSDGVYDQVHRLIASGVHVVLATGRSITATMSAARALDLSEGWAVCSNGAVTIRLDPALPGGFELIDQVTFDPAEALETVRAILPGAALAAEEVGFGWLVTAAFPPGELHGSHRVVTYEELCASPVSRVVVRLADMTSQEMADIMARSHLPAVTYEIGWTAWMDLMAPGVTKATGLERLRQCLGVPPSGTIAIGDGRNDIPMLAWASRGVAMGGAPDDVVAAASEVTATVADDGAASVLAGILAGLA